MRIAFVAPSYYPSIGGVEYVVKSVAERLVRMGHEVTVLAGEPKIEVSREEEINGVRVVRWTVWSPERAYHFPRRRSELKFLREPAKDCDVVRIHSILSMYPLKAVGDVGAKIVVTSHWHGTGHTALRKLP